jgi:hypothetical protein
LAGFHVAKEKSIALMNKYATKDPNEEADLTARGLNPTGNLNSTSKDEPKHEFNTKIPYEIVDQTRERESPNDDKKDVIPDENAHKT